MHVTIQLSITQWLEYSDESLLSVMSSSREVSSNPNTELTKREHTLLGLMGGQLHSQEIRVVIFLHKYFF